MSFIAEVVVVHPDLALASTIGEFSDTDIQLESQPATDLDAPILFYSVKSASFQEFESSLDNDHTVSGWQMTAKFAESRIYQIHLSSDVKVLTPSFSDLEVHVLAAESASEGWRLRVHSPDKDQLGAVWDHCREENINFHLEKLYSTGSEQYHPDSEGILGRLTDRQREVIQTVTEMGYYDQDGASAEEVAAALDIAPSTLSTHLRRIIAIIFAYLVETKRDRALSEQ